MKEPREVLFLLSDGQILWSDFSDSVMILRDKRGRWDEILKNRYSLTEIAHSHPLGPLAFSTVDQETMRAIEDALDQRFIYSVVAPKGTVSRAGARGEDKLVNDEPWWARLLRDASGM